MPKKLVSNFSKFIYFIKNYIIEGKINPLGFYHPKRIHRKGMLFAVTQPWVTAGCHDLANHGSGVTHGHRFRDPRVWREKE
jgi:hypothetical protein